MDFKLNTCEAEYAKDTKLKKEDVRQLMDWVEKQAHMPKVPEYMLIQLYQVCDYSLQRAKNLTELYYHFRNEAPELFSPITNSCNCSIWDLTYTFILPKETSQGFRLFYSALKTPDSSLFNSELIYQHCVKLLTTAVLEKGTCSGYILIYDIKDFSFAHLAGLNISLTKKFINFSQDTIPINMVCAYIINGHTMADKLERLIKPFIKKEINEKFFMRSNMEEFLEEIGGEYFPSDIGGTLPYSRDQLNEITRARMNAFSSALNEELQRKTDESKRMGKKQNESEFMTGSFKRLQVD